MILAFVSMWIINFLIALFLFQSAWRFQEDIGLGDFIFLCFLSLIPVVSIVAGIIVFLLEWSEKTVKESKIVLRRYGK